jgi:hypothetical protein
MADLEITASWFASHEDEPSLRETFGSLSITAGPDRTPLTEVEDTIARTVRPHIFVPSSLVAEWLLANWWRLRWEGARSKTTSSWRRAHCMAAIGSGYAWPFLTIESDGEFVQLRTVAESAPDAAAVRYLQNATIDLPASEFEAGVDEFLDSVEARLAACVPSARTISELRAELTEERRRLSVARECKWQALAGMDPGDAAEDWLEEAKTFADDVGHAASEEVFAALPSVPRLDSARDAFLATKASSTTVDLRWTATASLREAAKGAELPWQRGVRSAQLVRKHYGIAPGPLDDDAFGSLVSAHLPLASSERRPDGGGIGGGFRNCITGGRTAVLAGNRRPESARFYLARVVGCALAADQDDHFLPVTSGATALQKFERAFAQELLCPWKDLVAFVEERGSDEEGLADAAEHFGVSEYLVSSTLVNRGKLERDRLPIRL